jgi:hypothetical protein
MITTKNIIAIYKLAKPSEIYDGLSWYINANKDCQEIADKFKIPLHIVVGVLSALSPNNKYERNVQNANDLWQ